jgi:hypothetical protein
MYFLNSYFESYYYNKHSETELFMNKDEITQEQYTTKHGMKRGISFQGAAMHDSEKTSKRWSIQENSRVRMYVCIYYYVHTES